MARTNAGDSTLPLAIDATMAPADGTSSSFQEMLQAKRFPDPILHVRRDPRVAEMRQSSGSKLD